MLRSLLSRQRALGPCMSAAASAAPATAPPAAGGGGGWWGLAAAAVSARLHTAGAPLLASLQVKIPALGESISDGTVSAVLKQAGDRVEEDEPILQIETDKVTVDVRAPRAGVIEAILVKPDDNVEVGHVVASIGDGDGAQPAAAAAPAPPQPTPAPQQPQQQPPEQPRKAAPAAAAAAPAAAAPAAPEAAPPAAPPAGHRAPSIAFPPRRTPEGEPISALPPAAAKQLLAAMLSGGGAGADAGSAPTAAAAAAASRPPVPDQYKHMIAVPIVGGSMPTLRGMPVPAGPPGPPRRTMTDAEMEAIMLGGAEP